MIFAVVAFYLAMALFRLDYPGVHYDELYYVNAALGDIDELFIYAKRLGIPLYLMPYVGALKSWIYFPILKVFGVSVWSLRLPMILLCAFSLTLFFRIAEKFGGRRAAWMASFLLAANASFVYATKLDFGPVVIEWFLQLCTILTFLSGGAPLLMALLCVAGIFNKVNFIGWVVGLAVAIWFFYPERRKSFVLPLVSSVAFVAIWFLVWGNNPVGETNVEWAYRFSLLRQHSFQLLTGFSLYDPYLGPKISPLVLPVIWLSLVGYGLWWVRRREEKKEIYFFATLIGAIVFLTLFSVRARSYWHFFSLLPPFYLLSALLLAKWKRIGLVLWGAAFLALLSTHGFYWKKYNEAPEQNLLMTRAIYPLIDYCRQWPQGCITGEWGMYSQLQAFIQDPKRIRQYPRSASFEEGPLYVVYGLDRQFSANPGFKTWGNFGKRAFFYVAERGGYDLELVHTIMDHDVPAYELYRLKKAK